MNRTEQPPLLTPDSVATRFAKDRLTALAQSKGAIAKPVPEVLFVCLQNAGRSQMAAAYLRELGGDRIHVRSAGSQPASDLGASVVRVMGEAGLDLAQEFPKPLTDDVVRAADVVITMGCGDACPVYPGKQYLDWHLDELTLDEVRRCGDLVDKRYRQAITAAGAGCAAALDAEHYLAANGLADPVEEQPAIIVNVRPRSLAVTR